MKRHGKPHMPVDCLVRVDVANDEDFAKISSRALHKVVSSSMLALFGATTPMPAVLLADAETRIVRFTIARSAVDKLRAACVLVSECGGVFASATVVNVVRHKPSRRPPVVASAPARARKMLKRRAGKRVPRPG